MKPDSGLIRILLVASENTPPRELARHFPDAAGRFELSLQSTPETALDHLQRIPFDVIVADLGLPCEGAVTAFARARESFPRVVRVILGDEPTNPLFAHAAHLAHVLLPRTCDARTLCEVTAESVGVARKVHEPRLLSAIADLASLPQVAAMQQELLQLLSDEDLQVEELETALERNPPMVAKILHVANSAFYGMRSSVASVGEAVSLLGFDTVRGIVASAKVFELLPGHPGVRFPIEELWHHSVASGVMLRRITRHVRVPAIVQRSAFASALLHDVGKLVLLGAYGENYAELLRQQAASKLPLWQVEEKAYGQHHGTIGGLLLEWWGLPRAICEAVALHHTPHRSGAAFPTPATLVHLADALAHAHGGAGQRGTPVDGALLQRLRLPLSVSDWDSMLEAA